MCAVFWDQILGRKSFDAKMFAVYCCFGVLLMALTWWLHKTSYIKADETGVFCFSAGYKQFAAWEQIASYSEEILPNLKGEKRLTVSLKNAAGAHILGFPRTYGSKENMQKLLSYIDDKIKPS